MTAAKTCRYDWDFPVGHRDARPMACKPEVGLVQSRWEVRNQDDEPVMTMEGWGMFRRRPAACTVRPPACRLRSMPEGPPSLGTA